MNPDKYNLEVIQEEIGENPRKWGGTFCTLAITNTEFSHLSEHDNLVTILSVDGDTVTPKVSLDDDNYDENYPYGEYHYGYNELQYDVAEESDLIRYACRSDILALALYANDVRIWCDDTDTTEWTPNSWGYFEYDYKQIGFALITREYCEQIGYIWGKADKQKAIEIITDEIDDLNMWWSGEMYEYIITDTATSKIIDSCGGYDDYDEAYAAGESSVEYYVQRDLEEHVQHCEEL